MRWRGVELGLGLGSGFVLLLDLDLGFDSDLGLIAGPVIAVVLYAFADRISASSNR